MIGSVLSRRRAQRLPSESWSPPQNPGEHDGYKLIARLRALPGGQTVPAVALTALARSEDRTRALAAASPASTGLPIAADLTS